ncbi:hypothetical protein [Streptomyces sp. ODS28]|uniref:hypothetical protein n=1 Tax=Streptomyces sp. ODS28 TaxID=3136688 RepID=UPI0031E9CF19
MGNIEGGAAVAQLQHQQDMDVFVEFSGFSLQESDEDFLDEEYPDGRRDGAGMLTAHVCRVDVKSEGHTHTAPLTAEVWDAEPPADTSTEWEAQEEAELYSPSGELAVWSYGGAMEEYLYLGAEKMRWSIRVHCTGRSRVKALTDHGVPHGAERYLVQFWPADA